MLFRAAEALKQCGPLVTLQVLKDAANRQGLSALLSKPSENHNHPQPTSNPLARFPATSNPSLMSHQPAPISSSSLALKSASSHERLLTHQNGYGSSHNHHHPQQQQHFATLAHPPHQHHHNHHHSHHQIQQTISQNGPSMANPARPASRPQMAHPSSSYEFVYNAKSVPVHSNHLPQRHNPSDSSHRLIQPARSAQVLLDDDDTHEEYLADPHAHQHQSNPNLFHSNPLQYPSTSMANNRNQTFDLPKRNYDQEHPYPNGYDQDHGMNGHHHDQEEDDEGDEDLQPSNFVRSASERQSFGDRNLVNAHTFVYREDVPPGNSNGYVNGHQHPMKTINHTQSAIGPTIAPKPPPKPMISSLGLVKPTNGTNENDLTSRLSKVSLTSSSSDHLTSSMRYVLEAFCRSIN